MCFYDKRYLANNLNYEILKGTIHLMSKESPNTFESLLLENFGTANVQEIYHLLGEYHLNRNQLEEAKEAFELSSKNTPMVTLPDSAPAPIDFAYSNNENGSLDDSLQTIRAEKLVQKYPFLKYASYTKSYTADALIELNKRAQQKDMNAAEYNFILGCYWANQQNIDWSFGNAKITENDMPRERQDLSWESYYDYDYRNYYFNPDIAIRYLDKAIALSNDPELKAKACFMAATAERHRNYAKGEFVYFGKLHEEYSDTEYYKEAIQECGYFKSYCSTN